MLEGTCITDFWNPKCRSLSHPSPRRAQPFLYVCFFWVAPGKPTALRSNRVKGEEGIPVGQVSKRHMRFRYSAIPNSHSKGT